MLLTFQRSVSRSIYRPICITLLALLVVGCSASATGQNATALPATPASPAAAAILQYLNVRNTGDENALAALVCAAFEADARTEALSFASRNPRLENVSCTIEKSDVDSELVRCTGQLIPVYNGEQGKPIDLSRRLFRTVQEGESVKMCGYATE